jgi:hypothetical protein
MFCPRTSVFTEFELIHDARCVLQHARARALPANCRRPAPRAAQLSPDNKARVCAAKRASVTAAEDLAPASSK